MCIVWSRCKYVKRAKEKDERKVAAMEGTNRPFTIEERNVAKVWPIHVKNLTTQHGLIVPRQEHAVLSASFKVGVSIFVCLFETLVLKHQL